MAKKSAKKPAAKAKLKPASGKAVVTAKSSKRSAPTTRTAKPAAKAAAKPLAKTLPVKSAAAKARAKKAVSVAKPAAPAVSAKAKLPLPPAATKPVLASPQPLIKTKKLKRPDRPRFDDTPVRLPPPPVTSDSKMAKNRAGLSQRDLEYFRDLLLEKRRELLGDVTSMERDALRSGNTNLSSLPMHMADTGTDNYEQEFTLGLVEKDRQLLREINTALAKIQDGSYGICEGTGKPISKARLEAQPWARYSIEHARALEKPMFRRAF